MSIRRVLCTGLATLLIVASLAPGAANAVTCFNFFQDCWATTTIEDYDEYPAISCSTGWDVVEVTSEADPCAGGGAGPATALRCGKSSDPLIYSGNGRVHKIQPVERWQDVLDGGCTIQYKNGTQPG